MWILLAILIENFYQKVFRCKNSVKKILNTKFRFCFTIFPHTLYNKRRLASRFNLTQTSSPIYLLSFLSSFLARISNHERSRLEVKRSHISLGKVLISFSLWMWNWNECDAIAQLRPELRTLTSRRMNHSRFGMLIWFSPPGILTTF